MSTQLLQPIKLTDMTKPELLKYCNELVSYLDASVLEGHYSQEVIKALIMGVNLEWKNEPTDPEIPTIQIQSAQFRFGEFNLRVTRHVSKSGTWHIYKVVGAHYCDHVHNRERGFPVTLDSLSSGK